jgi:hypothetical protein
MGAVLLVVDNTAGLSAQDTCLKGLLEGLGHTVTTRNDSDTEASSASYDLCVISESVVSTSVGTKYKTWAKPVLINEPFILDDHDLASTPITLAAGTTAWVSDAGHAGADGNPVGSVTTHSASHTSNIGSCSGHDADVSVYLLTASGGNPVAFTVNAGVTVLNGHVTVGKRGFLGLSNNPAANNWTATANGLFEALVDYLLPPAAGGQPRRSMHQARMRSAA